MKKLVMTSLILALTLFAVSNLFAVSQAAVLFLLISPGARASGMGETFAAVADDASAVFWNPAGLAFQSGREITIMHAKWLPQLASDMSFEFLAYRQYIESLGGTLGANVTFLNLGEQVHTGETGPEPLGTFHSWDLAVSLSYATKLNPHLGLGVGVRYIHSNLAPLGAGEEKGKGVGSSFAVDVGVLYKFPFVNDRIAFGANLSNMGPKITYIDAAQADPLPTNIRLGLSFKVLDMEYNKLTFAYDTYKLLVRGYEDENEEWKYDPFYKAIFSAWGEEDAFSSMVHSVGMEYAYNNMIFIRAGYYYDEEGKVKYPTFGAGLQYASFRFDFAYIAAEPGHQLSDTMRFSLTAGF